ncbi:MAG: CPBP family intramembrane metalloprotease, partial [Nitrospinae bacterium]|nr:CPBP family intramembrane metalloprotease [Nitrospinota bacterium]
EEFHPLSLAAPIFLFPLLTQIFFTGLIFQGLSNKYNPALAIYGAGIIFTLGHFKLNLGIFFLGIITAFLFRLTGTLYASILFHTSCSLAGMLLLYIYPRLTTLLGFLF